MRMHSNALDNQVVPDSEIISLNAKFTLNHTLHELQVQVKHKLNSLRWTKITSRLFSSAPQATTQNVAIVVSDCDQVEPATRVAN